MGNRPSISKEQYEANRAGSTVGKEVYNPSAGAKVAFDCIYAYNTRNNKLFRSLIAKDAYFSYKGADACVSFEMFIPQVEKLQDSFPDLYITFDEILETEPGVVRVSNVYSRGTHTGVPFAYEPFPPIPKTGIVCEDGPSQTIYLIENGKIKHIQMELAPDDLTPGMIGWYIKIGGKVEMTEK